MPDGTMDHRREMIEWKFAQMDLDHNGKQTPIVEILSSKNARVWVSMVSYLKK